MSGLLSDLQRGLSECDGQPVVGGRHRASQHARERLLHRADLL